MARENGRKKMRPEASRAQAVMVVNKDSSNMHRIFDVSALVFMFKMHIL